MRSVLWDENGSGVRVIVYEVHPIAESLGTGRDALGLGQTSAELLLIEGDAALEAHNPSVGHIELGDHPMAPTSTVRLPDGAPSAYYDVVRAAAPLLFPRVRFVSHALPSKIGVAVRACLLRKGSEPAATPEWWRAGDAS
jgi:hypothetical protein